MKGRILKYFMAIAALVNYAYSQHSNSHVTLSLNEFEELFSSARLEDAERRLMDQRKVHEAEHKRKLTDLEGKSKFINEQARRQTAEMFPTNFQVLQHIASGSFNSSSVEAGVERDAASFDLELTIRIMEEKWTVIPLVNTTSTVAANWRVYRREEETEHYEPIDPVVDPSAMLMLRENQQVFATNRSGLFKISFNAYTRVGKTRNLNSMGLSNLLYPLSKFSFRVAQASPNTLGDFSVQPPTSILQVKPSPEYTDIFATLPLTADSLQIRWMDVKDNAKVEAEEKGGATPTTDGMQGTTSTIDNKPKTDVPHLTATHQVLHTIGEGIIRSVHTLEFKATSEVTPLNSVQFLVHGEEVRVTSVVGHALQGWTVDNNDDSGKSKLVKASFKTSQLDSSIILRVHTERDRRDPSKVQVDLPRIECKHVIRQTGQVAVAKDANVEVHEHHTSGLSRCEASEISSQMRLNMDRPIVLSYKYLSPQNSVVLTVKEHEAMETLEAAIDRVHYKNLVTEKHMVHSLILILQSTKLQYLEISGLPTSASKYTVSVNSVPAKPVRGEKEGSILVPLLIGLNPGTANAGGNLRTSVEVNYFSQHDPLQQNGTLSLDPPYFALPVSVMTVHLRLPKSYEYQFSGDFGHKAQRNLEFPIPKAFAHTVGKRVVREDHKFSIVDDMWPEDREEESSEDASGGGGGGAVKILTPKTGTSFFFQRLLVVDNQLALNVNYTEPIRIPEKQSWWRMLL